MIKGLYRHFRNQKEYRALDTGIFRKPANDPLFDIALDADDLSRQVYVYLGVNCFVLEYADGNNPLGRECVVYRAQYSDPKLGENPLFVRSRADFFANVKNNGYSGPRFIKLSD